MRQSISAFLTDIYKLRSIIYELAKRDLQQQYQGSYLGFVWMFLQPLIFFSVLYMVITLGFRTGAKGDMPFELYLICGMTSWLYFSGTFADTTNVINAFSFLVKRVDFRLSILPIVKMFSALLSHLFLIVVAIGLCWYKGYPPTFYTLQILYYLAASMALLLGLGWLTSATSIFVKDVKNIVAIIIQFGFWLTPIFWNMDRIPEQYQWIIKLNPVCYIVTGYRDSLVSRIPFWHRPEEALYFWSVTTAFLFLGMSVFRKLRPHFAEVI